MIGLHLVHGGQTRSAPSRESMSEGAELAACIVGNQDGGCGPSASLSDDFYVGETMGRPSPDA